MEGPEGRRCGAARAGVGRHSAVLCRGWKAEPPRGCAAAAEAGAVPAPCRTLSAELGKAVPAGCLPHSPCPFQAWPGALHCSLWVTPSSWRETRCSSGLPVPTPQCCAGSTHFFNIAFTWFQFSTLESLRLQGGWGCILQGFAPPLGRRALSMGLCCTRSSSKLLLCPLHITAASVSLAAEHRPCCGGGGTGAGERRRCSTGGMQDRMWHVCGHFSVCTVSQWGLGILHGKRGVCGPHPAVPQVKPPIKPSSAPCPGQSPCSPVLGGSWVNFQGWVLHQHPSPSC